jgi:hypothetical protein
MLPGTGIRAQLNAPESEQIAELADQVQEWIIEELWGTAPTNWPPCPTHPTTHPLMARALDGVAVWCCPGDGEPSVRIGYLGHSERSSTRPGLIAWPAMRRETSAVQQICGFDWSGLIDADAARYRVPGVTVRAHVLVDPLTYEDRDVASCA